MMRETLHPPTSRPKSKTRALLYCTFNGVANCTNGIGRQAQTLLGTLERRWEELTAFTGDFTPYLAIPEPSPATWAYDPQLLADSEAIIQRRGGQTFTLAHDSTVPFWSPPVWQQLSTAAAHTAQDLATHHSNVAVIAVDTPFAGTGQAQLTTRPMPPDNATIETLLTLYGTAHLHGPPDPDRLAWEQRSLAATHHPDIHLADIGQAFTQHLRDHYDLSQANLITYPHSLDLAAPDLQPMPENEAHAVAAAFGVPLDRPIILAIGRTDPVKGLDQLITALRPLRDNVHLVAVVVPFDGHDPLTHTYREQISTAGLRATYIDRFTRDLPRALSSLTATAAVCCPSRAEPLANLPFEAAMWARHNGPIVVAPALGGFPESISHRHTGLLYEPHSTAALTTALREALALPAATRAAWRQNAYLRVAQEHDAVIAYGNTLTQLFATSTHIKE